MIHLCAGHTELLSYLALFVSIKKNIIPIHKNTSKVEPGNYGVGPLYNIIYRQRWGWHGKGAKSQVIH